MKGVICYDHPL